MAKDLTRMAQILRGLSNSRLWPCGPRDFRQRLREVTRRHQLLNDLVADLKLTLAQGEVTRRPPNCA